MDAERGGGSTRIEDSGRSAEGVPRSGYFAGFLWRTTRTFFTGAI